MYDDSEDMEMLRARLMQKVRSQQLAEDQTPAGSFGRNLAMGGFDILQQANNNSLNPVETLTGLKLAKPNGQTDSMARMQQAQTAEATRRRQAALDDMGSMTSIQRIIDARKEREAAKGEKEAASEQERFLKGIKRGPNGFEAIPGGAFERGERKTDAEIKKLEAEAKAAPGDRELKRRLLEAQLESLGARTNATNKKANAVPAGPKFNKDQNDAGGYGRRLEQAEQAMLDVAKGGYNRSDFMSEVRAQAPSWTQDENTKLQAQAERNFVNANLRRESGAAISPEEFASAEQQYFPRAGDTPQVLAQKAANRKQAIENLRAASAGAMERIPLVPTEAPAGAGGLSPEKKARLEFLKAKYGR